MKYPSNELRPLPLPPSLPASDLNDNGRHFWAPVSQSVGRSPLHPHFERLLKRHFLPLTLSRSAGSRDGSPPCYETRGSRTLTTLGQDRGCDMVITEKACLPELKAVSKDVVLILLGYIARMSFQKL